MKWSVAKAREHFSEVLRKAAAEPQEIYNRERLVAAVIGPEAFQVVGESSERDRHRTLADSAAELRKVMADEGYSLRIPPRKNRKTDLPKVLDELSR